MGSGGEGIEKLLLEGAITIRELSPWGTNYTFVVDVRDGANRAVQAIYKPSQGEAPLWDFPYGSLYKREYGAYLLSQALGWELVPLTVVRGGPYGVGSVQLYVDHDPRSNYFKLRGARREAMQAMACFDLVANNADRKAGHCIQDGGGHVWGIDHGLTFHAHFKLRTVIWDFRGQEVPERLLADLRRLRPLLDAPAGDVLKLTRLLAPEERVALVRRVDWLLKNKVYPLLDPYRNVPRPPW